MKYNGFEDRKSQDLAPVGEKVEKKGHTTEGRDLEQG